MRIPCYVLLPLTFNDGSSVPDAMIAAFEHRFFAEFGGSTVEGTVTGTYRMQDTGTKQVEKLLKVKVAVEGEEGVAALREIVAEIGHDLGQECMYFEVQRGSNVEFVSPKKGGSK